MLYFLTLQPMHVKKQVDIQTLITFGLSKYKIFKRKDSFCLKYEGISL